MKETSETVEQFKAWWTKYNKERGFEPKGATYRACRSAWMKASAAIVTRIVGTGFGPDENLKKRQAHQAKICKDLVPTTGRFSSKRPNKANTPKRDTSMPMVKHNLGEQVENLLLGG